MAGLLLCLPTAMLLASAWAAVLAGKARRRLRRPTLRGDLVGQVLGVFAQAGCGGQRDAPLGLGPVVIDGCHGENKLALAETDRLDQDRAAGSGQDDHITSIDIASKHHILHR
jgi:hypothetical protein